VLLLSAALPLVAPAATPTDLLLSEYIEGSSFNKAIEIYNGTGLGVDLAAGGYSLELYSNGAASASQSVSLSGTIAHGDVFVLAHASADAAILAVADAISSAVINFNGDDAVVLRKNGAVVDAFGQVGVDPGSEWPGGGADDTLRRKASVCAGDTDAADAFDASGEWDAFAQNTFAGLGAHSVDCDATPVDPRLNEFSASTAGTDVEYVEIIGTPNTDYSGYTVLEIEGDGSPGAGTVDEVIVLGTTDANGLYLASLAANTLENGTLSLLLVESFTGTSGSDLDGDDDGSFDATPWSAVVDAVAVNDGTAGDLTYGIPVLGPNYDGLSSFAPGAASRIPDGFDSDSAGDWVRNDFDLAGIPGFTGTPVLGEALNTPGAFNALYEPVEACGDPVTLVSAIQGPGAASPLAGSTVSIEAVVVGDFQDGAAGTHGDLNGFFVQEEDADADADSMTSEGIFVFDGSAPAVDVQPGDVVRVSGTVTEFNGLTEINNTTFIAVCTPGNPLPAATTLSLPVAATDDFEPHEGMRVHIGSLVIAEYFDFDRFGEIVLATDRLAQPTSVFDPGSPEAAALADLNARSQILLDDGRSAQNPDPAIHPNGAEFDLDNRFRGGDIVENATGVLDYGFGRYRLQPTQGADYTPANPRGTVPEVGGGVTVASFNVLNYFNGDGLGGGFPTSRGASDLVEFARQRAKIVAAMTAIDADVFGLIEIENDGYGPISAIQDLVNGLNDATAPGRFGFVDPGVPAIGLDEIAVGLVYKTAAVTPQGASAILDATVDPRFLDTLNRPALAQTFVDAATGGVFTVVVNHLKSKGSDCNAVGDPDLGDGAGNCNLTRKAAAEALVDWLATDPTGSDDADALIIGDLNSYDKEDPIDVFTAAGHTDLLAIFGGEFAYSYLFGAQLGYLDYALASPSLFAQTTGAAAWHINADEPDLLNYDMTFKLPAQDAIYAPDPFRSSDHDPVIGGFDLAHFDFAGFFRPLANVPDVNKAKAGSSVPIKFSLGGDYGLDIVAVGYPKSQAMDCADGTPGSAAETDTAGGSSLYFDADADQYVYVWSTQSEWSGTCRRFVLQLEDGSLHYANFEFK
jgi:hypothetical protein